MLFLVLLLLQLLGTCLIQADMTPEEEQSLINYVIELYYYPNKPDIHEYNSPEEYPNFKKRYYIYDHINCLHESDILGVIDASILSHTICISLCDEYKDCTGGLYSKIRSKCYLLKKQICMPDEERLAHSSDKDGRWNVFFFFNARPCDSRRSNAQCEDETTTAAPVQATTLAETESDQQRERQGQAQVHGQGVRQPSAHMASTSMSVILARSAADPFKSVAESSYNLAPRQITTPTSSRRYRFQDVGPSTVGEVVNQMTNAEPSKLPKYMEDAKNKVDVDLETLAAQHEKQGAKPKVKNPENPLRHRPYQNPRPLFPTVPTHQPGESDEVKEPEKEKKKKEKKSKKEFKLRCSQPSSRRKRSSSLAGYYEKCKKVADKMMKSIDALKKKVNYAYNLPANLYQDVRQKVEEQFERLKNNKYGGHLKKLNKAGQMAAFGLMAGTLVEDLLSGNFEGVAMNVGFFILAYASAKATEKAAQLGSKFLAKGKIKAGWLLKAAGPFLHAIGTAFVAWEFYKSIRDLNTSDPDTIANAVANGVLLGVELFELGVVILATAGVITGSAAAVAGPIGIAVAAVVFVGLRIYYVVQEVERIKSTLKLSDWEIFREGIKRFFTGYGLQEVDKLRREKLANNQYRDYAIKALQNNKDLQMYFLPAFKYNGGDNPKIAEKRKIDLRKKVTVPYSRSAPDHEKNYEIVCFPPAQDHTGGTTTDYYCENAFGIMDKSRVGKTDTFFELLDGTDTVFARNVNNSYAIGNGLKQIQGNAANDIFILRGNTTKGSLDGSDGYDMIFAKFFHESVPVNFDVINKNVISINHFDYDAGVRQYINATNIEDIRGRPGASDAVTIPCNLKYLNALGGQNKIRGRDMIFLQEGCEYNVTITLGINSVLKNDADRGRFVYHFVNISGNNFIHLKKDSYQNIFVFEYKIEELRDIRKIQADSLIFYSPDHTDASKTAKISVKNFDNQTVFAFKEEVVVRVGNANAYLTLISDLNRIGIFRKYKEVAIRHGFILKARSKPESVAVVMGHDLHGFGNKDQEESKNVLSNEGDEITHIYPGVAKNVFLVTADEQLYNKSINNFSIPKIFIHYEYGPFNHDQIDLSVLAQKIKWNFKLDLIVEAMSEYKNKDIILYLHVIDSKGAKIQTIGEIVLENVIMNFAYQSITIALKSGLAITLVENPHITIESSDVSVELVPKPLSFDLKEHEMVVLTEDDVSFDQIINVDQDLGDFDYFPYNGSLVISNMANKGAETSQLFSVLLTNFTKSPLMQSLNFNFNDIWLSVKANMNVHRILNIPDATPMFNKFKSG